MQKTLAELAKIVEGEVVGDQNILITSLSGLKEAGEGDLAFLANQKYIPLSETSQASAILVSRDVTLPQKNLIRTDNPSKAFTQLIQLYQDDTSFQFQGVHPTAYVDASARLGASVSIGPHAIIEPHAEIGDYTKVGGGVSIAHHSYIGPHALIHPNVTIAAHTRIGQNVVIHSGSVIGADGFGYEYIDGKYEKIPQLGNVVIGDKVEIGANVTIDRARFKSTYIGEGTKIDNLVQIGHNCHIGKNCIIISLTGISGSVTIEDNCILAGQVGVAGHLTIGKGATIVGKAGIIKDVPAGEKVMGYPARPFREAVQREKTVQRLPVIIKNLKQRIQELEEKIEAYGKTKNT